MSAKGELVNGKLEPGCRAAAVLGPFAHPAQGSLYRRASAEDASRGDLAAPSSARHALRRLPVQADGPAAALPRFGVRQGAVADPSRKVVTR